MRVSKKFKKSGFRQEWKAAVVEVREKEAIMLPNQARSIFSFRRASRNPPTASDRP